MKRWIILIIVAVLFISIGAGFYYFNRFILPTIVKEKILFALSEATSGKVTLDEIRFNLFKGIVVSNLTFFDKDNPQQKLCTVKETSLSFLILPFFKEKKIIIPSLKLDSATLSIVRQKDNTLNIGYILDKFKQAPHQKKPPAVLIRRLRLTNSSLFFKDETFQTSFSATFKIADLLTNISLNKVSFETSAQLLRDERKTEFKFKGIYLLTDEVLNGNLVFKNLDLQTFQEYLASLPVTLEEGYFSGLATDFSIGFKKFSYEGRMKSESGSFSLKHNFYLKGKIEPSRLEFLGDHDTLKLAMNLNISDMAAEKDKLRLSDATVLASVRVAIPLQKQENLSPFYEGEVKINTANVSGVETIDKISGLSSNIRFNNTGVILESATAKILDTQVTAKAELKQNVLKVEAAGHFDLQTLLDLLPQTINLPAYEISGTTALDFKIISDLSSGKPALISGKARLEKIQLNLPDNNLQLASETGNIQFDSATESLLWHFDAVKYLKEDYRLDGELKNFKNPSVHAMVFGKNIKIQADLTKENKLLNISSLKGEYKNSEVNLKGQFDLKENLSIGGVIILDLKDLKDLIPQSQQFLKQSNIEGRCLITAEGMGSIKDYRSWNIKAKSKSSIIKYRGFKLQNVVLDYNQIKQDGFINDLSFDAYLGKGSVKGRLDFSNKNFGYALRCALQDIDLHQLKLDTPLKEKTFFGTLSMNMSVQGSGKDLNSLKGGGAFIIRNGNLWEFNPLKGLGNFLFIPRFSSIVFTNAQGDFFIQDGYISTDNLELLGPELGLLVEGKITFSGELDFLVNTQVQLTGLGQTEEGPGKVTEAISKAGSLTAIKVTGTVKEPKYKLQPIGANIMKKLGDILSNIAP